MDSPYRGPGWQLTPEEQKGARGRVPIGPGFPPRPERVPPPLGGPENPRQADHRAGYGEGNWPASSQYNPPRDDPSGDDGMMQALLDLLGGGGVDTGALGSAYDQMIAAQQSGLNRMQGIMDERIGGIRKEGRQARRDIGGFFGTASQAANKGRGAVRENRGETMGMLDKIYGAGDKQLGQIQGRIGRQTSAAAGGKIGDQVGARMDSAVAPFQAANASSKAASKGNVAANSGASANYLSQLSAASQSEGAMNQAAVTARQQGAVNNMQLEMAQQQAQVEQRMAEIEAQKQLAIIDATKDASGDTLERMMSVAGLMQATGSDMGPLRDMLGFQADPSGGMSVEDQLDLQLKAGRLEEQQSDLSNPSNLSRAMSGLDPNTAALVNNLRKVGDTSGGNQSETLSSVMNALALATNDKSVQPEGGHGMTIDQYFMQPGKEEAGSYFTRGNTDEAREILRMIYG